MTVVGALHDDLTFIQFRLVCSKGQTLITAFTVSMIMTPDSSVHFNTDVLTLCVTLCYMFLINSNEHKVNISTVCVLITCDQ